MIRPSWISLKMPSTNSSAKLHSTHKDKAKKSAVLFAFIAATFYALSTPFSKLLLTNLDGTILAGLLYLGAGIGMLIILLVYKAFNLDSSEISLGKSELKYIIAMVLLDIAAPIFLMAGLATTSAANVSLLNNFEIVTTTMIASLVFHEKISKSLGIGIALVTLSTMILSFQSEGSLSFSIGSVFVLLACLSWGLENNCTRMLSSKDPKQIVVIKGFGSGLGALGIGLFIGKSLPEPKLLIAALVLGFIAYGFSVYLYVLAQRSLGASKTSAFYAVAPFIGAAASIVVFRELPGLNFWVALAVLALGTYYTNKG